MYVTAKKIKYALLCACLTAFAAAVAIFPERYAAKCFEGFALWAECVLPSLFPFMVVSLIFIKTGIAQRAAGPLKRLARPLNLPPNAAVCFALSLLSGYPAGSRIVKEFYDGGGLTKDDCQKLAPLCSTSGPLFIIGSVGTKMFGDKIFGFKLFLAHALAVLAVGLIHAKLCKKSAELPLKNTRPPQNVLYDAFYGGVISVAVAGGFIAFFGVAAQIMYDFNILLPAEALLKRLLGQNAACGLCIGLVEVTSGCRAVAACGPAGGAIAGFLITFGGLSVLAQQLAYYIPAGVKPLKFAALKFLQGLLCAAVMLVLG